MVVGDLTSGIFSGRKFYLVQLPTTQNFSYYGGVIEDGSKICIKNDCSIRSHLSKTWNVPLKTKNGNLNNPQELYYFVSHVTNSSIYTPPVVSYHTGYMDMANQERNPMQWSSFLKTIAAKNMDGMVQLSASQLAVVV